MLVWHCLVSCSDIGRRTIILIYDEDFDHTTNTDLSVHGKGIKCTCKAISLNSTMFLCACPDSTSINYPGECLVYQCEECSKWFSNRSYFRKHKQVHLGRTKCKYCEVIFSSVSALRWHVKKYHTDQHNVNE